ncbi:S-layer homology domain-containing protein [Paenibacillus thalictri]|nr:S-layer homology domain-containing protein [Paenibacillus thalictri]
MKQSMAIWLSLALFLSLLLLPSLSFPSGIAEAAAAQDALQQTADTSKSSASAKAGELVDGQYTIGFTIYKKGSDEPSVMYDYVDRNSGKLTVSGGKKYVSFLLKQSAETKSFKTQVKGTLVETETVSTDTTANARVVRFEVDDLQARLKGWVKVYWQLPPPIGLYDHEYDVDLGFGVPVPAAADKAQPASPAKETEGKPTASNGGNLSNTPSANANTSGTPLAGSASSEEPNGSNFTDLQNHWAKDNIGRAVGLGLVNGYEDGGFHPNTTINRGEFSALLSRALKLEQDPNALSFSDADRIPAWVKPLLTPVVQAGIVNGYEDGTFRADHNITRAELAVTIVRALKLDVDTDAQVTFSDAGSIPQWAKAEVAAAYKQGLISGRDNNTFAPNDNATRAEAVTLILALHDKLQK